MKTAKPAQSPLEIRDLVKSFRTGFLQSKKVTAVGGLSFSLEEGEIFGLLGPNGAGKTTTLKMITGLIFPDKGEVKIFGHPSAEVKARARIGFLPENPWFYDYLTAREFLRMAGGIFSLRGPALEKRINGLFDQLGIAHAADLPMRKYSKGMLQRAGLAQALINDPDLVIMDEPLSGLDPIGRRELREIILGLKARGKTVLFSSHILSDVEEICDRVAILARGRLREIGSVESLLDMGTNGAELEVGGDPERIGAIADTLALEWVRSMTGGRVIISADADTATVLRAFLDAELPILELKRHRRSLESIFVAQSEKAKKEA